MTANARSKYTTLFVTILVCLVFMAPFLFLFSTAFKDIPQLVNQPRALFPLPLHPENLLTVIQQFPIARYFLNTTVVVLGCIIGTVFVSTLTGYAFARLVFKGREVLFKMTLACLFMPIFLFLIPRFVIFQKVGLLQTLLPLIIPSALGSPFSIFLVRQYLRSIPMELSEAAKMDGCSEFRIYAQIIMPLTKPIIATIAIFTVQWRWNDFLEPLIYLQSEKLYTVTLGLFRVLGQAAEEITLHLVMAFVIISIAPIILVFLFAQRQFVEGSTLAGLKL